MCRRITLTGEVEAGKEWKADIGEGWVFEVLPIAGAGYSGWDLAVDRKAGRMGDVAGYPDALLLATPPYGSLNEREIGTTFGLRAQDALGWEPRRFHFLSSPEDLRKGRVLFRAVTAAGVSAGGRSRAAAAADLLRIVGGAAPGEFEVLEAKLTEGSGDAKPFAEAWARNVRNIPHTIVQSEGNGSERGEIVWIRFRASLWLGRGFRAAPGVSSKLAKCAQ
jgi:hypothetical protein